MSTFVKIDQDTCIACGACIGEAPEIFDETDTGVAFSLLDDNAGTTVVPENLIDDLEAALDSCPTDSIKTQDSAF